MLIWDRKIKHRFFSPEKRFVHIANMLSTKNCQTIKRISLLINIAVPAILYFCFGIDFVLYAIVFIGMDVFLNLLEQIVFITIPYLKTKIKSLKYVRKRIDFLQKQLETVRKSAPDGYYYFNAVTYKADHLATLLQNEKDFLREIEHKKNNNEATSSITQVAPTPQPSVVDFFAETSLELNRFVNDYNMNFLISLRKLTNSMSSIIREKPEKQSLIPFAMYIELEEFLKVLKNIVVLDISERGQYVEDAKIISKIISDEMQHLITSINKAHPNCLGDLQGSIERLKNIGS